MIWGPLLEIMEIDRILGVLEWIWSKIHRISRFCFVLFRYKTDFDAVGLFWKLRCCSWGLCSLEFPNFVSARSHGSKSVHTCPHFESVDKCGQISIWRLSKVKTAKYHSIRLLLTSWWMPERILKEFLPSTIFFLAAFCLLKSGRKCGQVWTRLPLVRPSGHRSRKF